MKSKTVLVPNAQAGELVAKGEVEMGVARPRKLPQFRGLRWSALCPVI
jgi:molybdate transport system substrate-binding protein